MIYGYEQPTDIPVMGLYDNQMMLAAVSAAKDMYDKSLAELKEFNKTYGDFYSPLSNDMDNYNRELAGVRNIVNQIYANGYDLRNPQARALVQKAIMSVNPTDYTRAKTSAAVYAEYMKNKGELEAKGLYNADREREAFIQQYGVAPEDWNTAVNGVWTRTSPVSTRSFSDITKDVIDNVTPTLIEEGQEGYDPRFYRYTKSKSKGLEAMRGLLSTAPENSEVAFYRDQFKKNILANYPDLSDTEATAIANEQFAQAGVNTWAKEFGKIIKQDENQYYLEKIRLNNEIAAARVKSEIEQQQHKNNRLFDITHPLPSQTSNKQYDSFYTSLLTSGLKNMGVNIETDSATKNSIKEKAKQNGNFIIYNGNRMRVVNGKMNDNRTLQANGASYRDLVRTIEKGKYVYWEKSKNDNKWRKVKITPNDYKKSSKTLLDSYDSIDAGSANFMAQKLTGKGLDSNGLISMSNLNGRDIYTADELAWNIYGNQDNRKHLAVDHNIKYESENGTATSSKKDIAHAVPTGKVKAVPMKDGTLAWFAELIPYVHKSSNGENVADKNYKQYKIGNNYNYYGAQPDQPIYVKLGGTQKSNLDRESYNLNLDNGTAMDWYINDVVKENKGGITPN